MDGLFYADFFKQSKITFWSSLEYVLWIFGVGIFVTLSYNFSMLLASKGGLNIVNSYNIHPNDQTSLF